ncbi:MAG: NAD-dependent deacylase [Gemmatimonadaceae bacterium]
MTTPLPTNARDAARAMLAAAHRIVVLTGAGVSAESGVPTFRGPEGLWRNFRPEELATPDAFARDPRLVWEWYGWRRERVGACRPNAAHAALARLALAREGVRVITQNVDELHTDAARAAAGTGDASAALPLELHGSIFRVRCTACPARYAHRRPIDASSDATLPRCDRCSALLRPDIVWFGEQLDHATLNDAFRAAERAAVCLVVGTSAVVHPAASIATATLHAGGQVIEVNPEETPLTRTATLSLRGAAAEVVPELLRTSP